MKILHIIVVVLVILSTMNELKSGSTINPITVSIKNPERGYLYIQDTKVSSTPTGITMIVGKITVKVEYSGEVSKVKFYVDGIAKGVDYDPPFEWIWDETIHGLHKLSVKAYDDMGNNATDELTVIVFNYEKPQLWSLTENNSWIDDTPSVRDFIPIGIVHMETKDHILVNLPDSKWGLQCFIFVGEGETKDGKHKLMFQCRAPITGFMQQRIYLDDKWYYLPPTKAPMHLDDEKRIYPYPTVYTLGDTISSISYDEENRRWIFQVKVPSKGINIEILGQAQGVPFWMGKPEGPYIIHGVSCKRPDIDIWGGFWDVGTCTINLSTPQYHGTFYGFFLFDRAYHRTYYTKRANNRGDLADFTCIYIHDEEFDLMFSHSNNPSPLKTPVPMQHQARINFPSREISYPLDSFEYSDDGLLQPTTFHFTGRYKDSTIDLTGTAYGYWPEEWIIKKHVWWNLRGEHTWGRAFITWNGTITLGEETIEVKDALGFGEFTRYSGG